MGEPGRRVSVRRWVGTIAGLTFLGAALMGCATTVPGPRTMKPEDLKLIAGEWRGTAYVQGQQAVAIQGFIYENGAFYVAPRGNPANQVSGFMRIVDGKVVYESPASDGTMTFHEGATEWTWKWQGKTKNGSAVTTELTKGK
jgi:hypothetical protein